MNRGLYVVMGVAGAGKSLIGAAFARALDVAFVDGDDFHPASNVAKMASGVPLTDEDRASWLQILGAQLAEAHDQRRGLVLACSALKRRYRDELRAAARSPLQFIHLRGARDLIAERLTQRRGHFMPVSMLESQLAALEEPGTDERAWSVDVSDAPNAITDRLVARVREGGGAA